MKTHIVVALSLFVGIGLGAAGVQTLHAQSKPPVYLIENNQITNPSGYVKEFLSLARPTVQAHGGRVIAAGKGIAVEGAPPNNRVVIIRWDTLEQLTAWHHSAEYQNARKVGNKYATFNSFAVTAAP
jgi:uncharacterized protein (DUF1330 family)